MSTELEEAAEYFIGKYKDEILDNVKASIDVMRRRPVTDFVIVRPEMFSILNAPPIAPYSLSHVQHVGRIKRVVSAATLKRRAKQKRQRQARLITKRQ